jgi:viroplasmin and RNaseH domain-containing protein
MVNPQEHYEPLNKKEMAKEFTRQMLDPNTPSINFEQVTTMLGGTQQTHKEVLSNMDSYRIRERVMDSTFSARHSQLQSLNMQLDSLKAKMEQSSTLFSKSRKSSLWQRYWTAVTVGAISALLTNLLLMVI